MKSWKLRIVKLAFLFCLILSKLSTALAASTEIPSKSIPFLLEKADSLADLDGRRALLVTKHILREVGDETDSIYIRTMLIQGNAYFSMGLFEEAIANIEEGLALAEKTEYLSLQIQAHSDLGVICRVTGELEDALSHYEEALRLLKEEHNPESEANVLISLSILYNHTGRPVDAEKFAKRAFEAAGECGDSRTCIYVLNNYGIILHQNGRHKEGLAMIRKAMNLAEKQGFPNSLLKVYTSMLALCYLENRPDSVSYYMRKGGKLMSQVPEASVESVSFLQQSAIILTDYGKYELSNELWHKLLARSNRSQFVSLNKVYRLMAVNYKGLKDYEKMQQMYERAIEAGDSLRSLAIDRQMSDFNVKYGTAQKELKIAKMEVQEARFRFGLTLWIAIVAVGLFILFSYIFIRNRQFRRVQELQRVRERLEGIEQERARLAKDLHDGICNDLLGVGYMLQADDCEKEEILHMIDDIREEVRTLSHNLLPPQFHSLNIDQLLMTMAQKTPDFIQYHSEHDEPWVCVSEDVSYQLYRIVQELVANVRKHTESDALHIEMILKQKKLELRLSYYGETRSCPALPSVGIGLETIRRRLMLIGASLTQKNADKHKEMIIELKM